MLHRVPRITSLAVLCAAALLGACSKGDATADSAKMADSIAAAAAPAPAPAPPPLTDANILAKLDADNVHDSTGGSMAATKGTDAGVKEFGRMMMKEHHQMRVDGMALAKQLNITPEMPPSAEEEAEVKAAMDTLTTTPKGAAWDKWYIDHNVKGHEKVLAFAQTAANTTQSADLKAMLEKATPIVQKHLDRAKELQAKMGGTAAAPAGDTAKKP